MNKADFVNELATLANIPRKKALEVTNAMLDILSRALAEKEEIQFVGFGTFDVKYSPERMARNPKTNEPAIVPARYKPVFKPGKHLLDSINGK